MFERCGQGNGQQNVAVAIRLDTNDRGVPNRSSRRCCSWASPRNVKQQLHVNVQLTNRHVTASVVVYICCCQGNTALCGCRQESTLSPAPELTTGRRQATLLNFETARGCVKVYFSNVNTQTVERAGLLAHSSEIPTGKTLYDVQSLLYYCLRTSRQQLHNHAGVPSQLGSLPLSVVLK